MANSLQIPIRPKAIEMLITIPTEAQRRKYLFFRTTCNKNFPLPFSEMASIQCTVEMMQNFENIYIREIESLENSDIPDNPFLTDASRDEAFTYARDRICALEIKYGPALVDLQSLPAVDEADADNIFREIHDQVASTEAKLEAGQLWNEIYFEYIIKRHSIQNVRSAWHSELEHLVREYDTAFSGLLEEEQKLFLTALDKANPEKSMLSWIAMCGPRTSSIYALAQLSLSS